MALITSVRDGVESINADLKAAIDREFQRFISDRELSEFTFMSSFTAPERIYVHNKAKSLELMSKSRGKGINRQVTIYKKNRSTIIQHDATMSLTQHSHKVVACLLNQAPLTAKEKFDIIPHSERDRSSAPDLIQKDAARTVNRLVSGVAVVPSNRMPPAHSAIAQQRQALPIFALRDTILHTINDNTVVIISGETGSGKTTQVPQYIMEWHANEGRPCRIICSQPRRIAATAMGERVAAERNCKVGSEVGYQIRHESLTNARTVLTYITNGILLRTLMCGDSTLSTVTHLIMDEIHIRDRVSDFILVAVREMLAKNRAMRLVLISASVDTADLSRYFNGCPVITVPGRLFTVNQHFLEDVLKLYVACSLVRSGKECGNARSDVYSGVACNCDIVAGTKHIAACHAEFSYSAYILTNARTVLTYITNGILLRTLMCGDSTLSTVTHLIMDEIHIRDRVSDFILVAVREMLAKNRAMRLVLISASVDTADLSRYFNGCPVITVPGRLFTVNQHFLEDVLKLTDYKTEEMELFRKDTKKRLQQDQEANAWMLQARQYRTGNSSPSAKAKEATIDSYLENATRLGCEESLRKVLQLIRNNEASVDHQHPSSRVTPLMAACMHGHVEIAEELLILGASLDLTINNNKTAYQFAKEFGHEDIQFLLLLQPSRVTPLMAACMHGHVEIAEELLILGHPSSRVTPLMAACMHGHVEIAEELLILGASLDLTINNNKTAYQFAKEFGHEDIQFLLLLQPLSRLCFPEPSLAQKSSKDDDKYLLLEAYSHCFNSNEVNPDLILAIINKIQSSNQPGAVLIFLPGYEEIMLVMDKLAKREMKANESKLQLVALHSQMDTNVQKNVFPPAPNGFRKVILSTNLAETCITLTDVVFVIDTGLVRESGARGGHAVVWCSQACVRQRRARAGRTQPGFCYHLFSAAQYQLMPPQRKPQIPLQNLCLQTKMLAQGNIADFLAKTLDPPSFLVVRHAVQLLKTIDALDPCEELTLLGQHIIDLPLAPHLAKALLYAVLLKCLDPVLTIVAMLSYDDPMELGDDPKSRREAAAVRRRMGGRSQSDHCALLMMYMRWLASCSHGQGRKFCADHHLCYARLELVYGHRQRLLTQLRTSAFVRSNTDSHFVRDLNKNSEKFPVVKAALTGGHYPNLVRIDRQLNAFRTHDEVNVALHPSSVLRDGVPQKELPSQLVTDWIIFEEKVAVGSEGAGGAVGGASSCVRVCSLVSDVTVALFAGPARFPSENLNDPEAADRGSDSEEEQEVAGVAGQRLATLKLDEWVVFRLEPYLARLVIMLRNKWHAVLAKRLRYPNRTLSTNDEAVIEALVAVLCEEEPVGLEQPSGVGAKPLPISHHENNDYSPLRRRSYNDISKQQASSETSSNRHSNHRRNFDMNENGSSSAGTSIGSLSPSLPVHRCFFVIRQGNTRALERAFTTHLWQFQAGTECTLKNALREGKQVIIIFSLQSQTSLQGYARLKADTHWSNSDVISNGASGGWSSGDVMSKGPNGGWSSGDVMSKGPNGGWSSGDVMSKGPNGGWANDIISKGPTGGWSSDEGPSTPLPIEWIKYGAVPAAGLRRYCSLTDFNRFMSSRDGQEIDAHIGEAVCLLWESQPPLSGGMHPHMGMGGFQQNNGHGRPIRAPQQPYSYGNNSYVNQNM
ncbi:3'-5' RNA helicase YTHDC2 [Nilaparvata lugens]|uniref:3'-5' RNA helicase YTHDC2 n=1 Tax=Nilaparvata lugens TaxID=108931 RepID=UPI00193D3A82|nr:3'-5' RNA helicase YTHDC2 [Nilaparvata lugens]